MTCSFLKIETTDQIQRFLKLNDNFELSNFKLKENNLSILAEIGEYLENNGIVNNEKYKKYLDSKNYSEELKTCLIFRNMLMSEIVVDSKIRRVLHDYVPSPVPAIWVLRIFIHYILDYFELSGKSRNSVF